MDGLQGSMKPLKCGCDFVGRCIFLKERSISHQIVSGIFLNTKVKLSPGLKRMLRVSGYLGTGIWELSPPVSRDHFLLLTEGDWYHILALGTLFLPKQLICINGPSIAFP